MWWKYLIEWLAGSSPRKLVWFIHEKSNRSFSATYQSRHTDKKRQEFILKSSKDKIDESVRSRIIIVEGSSIFDLKGFSVSEPDEEKTLQFAAT